jgi:hypothetical protein
MPITRSYTCSYTHAKGGHVMPMIEAWCAQGASSILENPPFRHQYSNPLPVQHAPQCRAIGASQGCISEVPEEPNAKPPEPSDPGDGDDGEPDPESGTNSEADNPIPNPNLNAEANGEEQVGHQMLAALERLTNHGLGGGVECQDSRAKLWEPNQFNGSDPKKLRGFLFQCVMIYDE